MKIQFYEQQIEFLSHIFVYEQVHLMIVEHPWGMKGRSA